MRSIVAVACIALWASSVKAGLLPGYNLVGSPSLVSFQSAPSPGILAAPQAEQPLSHPAVVENAIAESQLPPELLNPFYKNPAIAAGLAKESWFINKEFPVHNREADKIHRSEIFKIISRLQRRRR